MTLDARISGEQRGFIGIGRRFTPASGTATVNKLLMGAIASAWGAEVNADAGSGILAERT